MVGIIMLSNSQSLLATELFNDQFTEEDILEFSNLKREEITNINQLPTSFSDPEGDFDVENNEELILSTEVGEIQSDLNETNINLITYSSDYSISTSNITFSDSEVDVDDTVLYDSEQGIDQENIMYEDGIQSIYSIDSIDSQHIISTEFLSSTEELNLIKDNNGFYKVVNEVGENRFDIGFPWATDVDGNFIETEYILEGNQLSQVIAKQPAESYPLKADPAICFPGSDTINNTKTYFSNSTLSVYPQSCARNYILSYWILSPGSLVAFFGSAMANDMWNEVSTESSMKPGGSGYKHRTKLKEQFVCHPIIIYKTSWNLDTWRPDVSLATTYLKACNS